MFYGIIVRMQSEKGTRHNAPHIHCEYSGEEVVVDFDGNILEGQFPKKTNGYIERVDCYS